MNIIKNPRIATRTHFVWAALLAAVSTTASSCKTLSPDRQSQLNAAQFDAMEDIEYDGTPDDYKQKQELFLRELCHVVGDLGQQAEEFMAKEDNAENRRDKATVEALAKFCATGQLPKHPTLPGQVKESETEVKDFNLLDELPTVEYVRRPEAASCQQTAVVHDGELLDGPASCAFYVSLEANQWCSTPDAVRAGQRQYPLKYGYRYCRRFSDLYNDLSRSGDRCPDSSQSFSGNKTLEWIEGVMSCLQTSLKDECENQPTDSLHCRQIWSKAFGTHASCYTASFQSADGGICSICPSHVSHVIFTVDARDFISLSSMRQIVSVGGRCGFRYATALARGLGIWPF